MKSNIFKNLFILDVANNHFGNISHAKSIINQYGKIIKKNKINAAIKFQFRDLDSFVHPDYVNSDHKFVRRFLDTRFSIENFKNIVKLLKKKKILTACTPFDENSVDNIEKLKFDILKIASVSALDFNLHSRVVKNKIPKIISTGGIKIEDIDKIVSFYKKTSQRFAIMHCVSLYPTEDKDLQVSFINELISRYKDVNIGWSTHEDPNNFMPSILASSLGAQIIEKHIGIQSKKFKLNKYSITPNQFENFYIEFKKSKEILGNNKNKIITKNEIKTLDSLQRGVYAKKNIAKDEKLILNKNVYFAFPLQKNQLKSSDFKGNIKTTQKIRVNDVISDKKIIPDKKLTNQYKIASYIHKAKAMLNYANIKIGDEFDMEISHHQGIDRFEKTGCFLFNIINREYAKKLLLMLPNQIHPLHFHKKKVESFIINHGTLVLTDNNTTKKLKPGDIVHLKKNSWHKFKSGNEGCIFEEISTTSLKNDSFYYKKKIKDMKRDQRKTYVNNWYSYLKISD